MVELSLGLRLLGWGKAILAWLKGLPWYVLALLACAGLVAWQHRTIAHQAEELAQAARDLAGWKRAHDADVATNLKLLGELSRQNAAVEALKAQGEALAREAARARQEAAQAAEKRNQALKVLKAAQAELEGGADGDDCDAPPAHEQIRGLL